MKKVIILVIVMILVVFVIVCSFSKGEIVVIVEGIKILLDEFKKIIVFYKDFME